MAEDDEALTEPEHGASLEAATRPAAGPGRRFAGVRPVRLADADRSGRLRLDALARHLQDVAGDDTRDAGLGDGAVTWVVRRAAIVVERWPRYLERVTYTTFCGGTGPRWAERRTSASGDAGGAVEAAVTWACIDARSGRLATLPDGFDRVWGATAGGRTVSARLVLPAPPPDREGRRWEVRAADLDVLGHVNNAVHWAAIEDELARLCPDRVPMAAECEYRLPVESDDRVTVVSDLDGATLQVWLVGPRGVHAAARVGTALSS